MMYPISQIAELRLLMTTRFSYAELIFTLWFIGIFQKLRV